MYLYTAPDESENCNTSPCTKILEASPPKPLHSMNLYPLVPEKVKSVTEDVITYPVLSSSISALNLLALPEPNSENTDLIFFGEYVYTVFLNKTGVTTAWLDGVVPVNSTTGGKE